VEDSSSLNVREDFFCVVVVVSTVLTVSFFVVLFVVVCSWVVLSSVVLPFVVLSSVLGGEDGSFVVLLEVEVLSVVVSFVVVLGVEVRVVVPSDVDSCVVFACDVDSCVVVVDSEVVSFALVVDGSAVYVAFRIEVGVVKAVEFRDVPGDLVLDFTSVTF